MSSKKIQIYKSFSSEATKKLGSDVAREFIKKGSGNKAALVFALKGDLGAGKTTFTQGFMRGLGSKKRVASPTFIIMRRHSLKKAQFKNVFHIDAYRLKSAKHLEVLEFKKITADPKNIIIIEWAERAKSVLPKTTVWIRFEHGKKENERKVIIRR